VALKVGAFVWGEKGETPGRSPNPSPANGIWVIAMGPSCCIWREIWKGREVFMVSVATILFGFLAMGFASKPWIFIVGVILFFIGLICLSHYFRAL